MPETAEPASASGSETANFTLSGMNPDEFGTSGFTLTQAGVATEDLTNFVHLVEINAPASTWNDLFHLKPDNDSTLGADIAQGGLNELYDIDIFEEESIAYKTDAAKLEVDSLPLMESTTATLQDNTLVQNEVVSEACIKAWSKDLFQKEYMDDIWANRTAIKTSIDNWLGQETQSDEQANAAGRNAGLVAAIRSKIAAATNKDNRSDQTTANLTRQLLLQLHAAVKGNTDGEKRLLNDADASSIFANGNKADDGYYAFLFKAGDTLSFGMTITHPNNYTANPANGSNNDEDNDELRNSVFDGSVAPRDMLFKVTVTMTE